jgi:arginyl-tRNA synthetase
MSKEEAIKKIEGLDWDKHPPEFPEKELARKALSERDELLREIDELVKADRKHMERISELTVELKAKDEALKEIITWANDYSLETFLKPDLQKAAEVLKAAGMTLDSVSADNMRQILDDIKNIVEHALKEVEI